MLGIGPYSTLLSVSKPYDNSQNRDLNESWNLCFESRECHFPGINIPILTITYRLFLAVYSFLSLTL